MPVMAASVVSAQAAGREDVAFSGAGRTFASRQPTEDVTREVQGLRADLRRLERRLPDVMRAQVQLHGA